MVVCFSKSELFVRYSDHMNGIWPLQRGCKIIWIPNSIVHYLSDIWNLNNFSARWASNMFSIWIPTVFLQSLEFTTQKTKVIKNNFKCWTIQRKYLVYQKRIKTQNFNHITLDVATESAEKNTKIINLQKTQKEKTVFIITLQNIKCPAANQIQNPQK